PRHRRQGVAFLSPVGATGGVEPRRRKPCDSVTRRRHRAASPVSLAAGRVRRRPSPASPAPAATAECESGARSATRCSRGPPNPIPGGQGGWCRLAGLRIYPQYRPPATRPASCESSRGLPCLHLPGKQGLLSAAHPRLRPRCPHTEPRCELFDKSACPDTITS